MTNLKIWALAVIALVVGFGVGYGVFHSSSKLGGMSSMLAESYIPYLYSNGGYYSALPIQTTSSLTAGGDLTVSGGTVNVTTSNTATSTLVVGCIQFYATSTATALKFQASTTPGVMISQYGTCPNL